MITNTTHEIKVLHSLYVSFNAYSNLAAPRIPGALEDSRHVSHCCRSHFNQMPKPVSRDDSCQLNYDLQVVPDVAIRRYKWDLVGHKRGPKRHVSFHPCTRVVEGKDASTLGRSSITHKS
jgi:hypothetical protein